MESTESKTTLIIQSGGAEKLRSMGIEVKNLFDAGAEIKGGMVEYSVEYIDTERLLRFVTTTLIDFTEFGGVIVERYTEIFCGAYEQQGCLPGLLSHIQGNAPEILWNKEPNHTHSVTLGIKPESENPLRFEQNFEERFVPTENRFHPKRNDVLMVGAYRVYPHQVFDGNEGFWIILQEDDKSEGWLGYPDTREKMVERAEISRMLTLKWEALKQSAVLKQLVDAIRPIIYLPRYNDSGTIHIPESAHWLVSRRVDFEGTVHAWFNAIQNELEGNPVPRGFSFENMVVYQEEPLPEITR